MRHRQRPALLPGDRHQPRRPSDPARQEARPAHHGDRHRQDRCRLPDLLEALEHALEPHRRAPPAEDSLPGRPEHPDRRPEGQDLSPFGDARWKIENGEVIKGREMYFAIYQALAKDEHRPGLYREYRPDFFDLIIVDECHRGSASDESNWREILILQAGLPARYDRDAAARG